MSPARRATLWKNRWRWCTPPSNAPRERASMSRTDSNSGFRMVRLTTPRRAETPGRCTPRAAGGKRRRRSPEDIAQRRGQALELRELEARGEVLHQRVAARQGFLDRRRIPRVQVRADLGAAAGGDLPQDVGGARIGRDLVRREERRPHIQRAEES